MAQMGIDWEDYTQLLKSHDIYMARNIPVDEFDTAAYPKALLKAAQMVDSIIRIKQRKVYIHCTSGISRAPTVVMAYLSFFKQLEQFADLQQVEDLIQTFNSCAVPNSEAVSEMLNSNKHAWNKRPNDFSEYLPRLSNPDKSIRSRLSWQSKNSSRAGS